MAERRRCELRMGRPRMAFASARGQRLISAWSAMPARHWLWSALHTRGGVNTDSQYG